MQLELSNANLLLSEALCFSQLNLRLDRLADLACVPSDAALPRVLDDLCSGGSVAFLQLLVNTRERLLHRLAERHHEHTFGEPADVTIIHHHEESTRELSPVCVVVLENQVFPQDALETYRWSVCALFLHLKQVRPRDVASIRGHRFRPPVVDTFLERRHRLDGCVTRKPSRNRL